MFGRAAARDLVEARFNEALSIAAQRPDSDFAELGLTAEQIADVRDAARQFELSGS